MVWRGEEGLLKQLMSLRCRLQEFHDEWKSIDELHNVRAIFFDFKPCVESVEPCLDEWLVFEVVSLQAIGFALRRL